MTQPQVSPPPAWTVLHPGPETETRIERTLREALAALHVEAQAQVYFSPYTVDFYLPIARLALEADGCMVHECPICAKDFSTSEGGYNPVHERRKHRDARLMQKFHLPVAHLWGHDLQTPQRAIAAVRYALAWHGVNLPPEGGRSA